MRPALEISIWKAGPRIWSFWTCKGHVEVETGHGFWIRGPPFEMSRCELVYIIYIYMYTYTHIHTSTYIHIYIYIYTYIYIYIYICIVVYMYI